MYDVGSALGILTDIVIDESSIQLGECLWSVCPILELHIELGGRDPMHH